MRPRWASPSSQKQFLNCERQWYYKRVLRMPEPPSFYLAIGNLYHSVFEHMVKEDVECLAVLVDDLHVEHASQPTWTCPTSEENLKREIVANAERVAEEIIDPLVAAGAVLTPEKSWKYLAKIDLLTSKRPEVSMGEIKGVVDEPGVLDYKIKFSTHNRRGSDAAENDEQLAMYCLLEEVNWAAFVEIPRSLKAPINVIGKQFSDHELEWWATYFDEQTAAINSRRHIRDRGLETEEDIEDRFRLAHPSNSLCDSRWCAYWAHCPGGGK
jgi:hypothetical protein